MTWKIAEISAQVRHLASAEGFDLAGIASIGPHPELNGFQDWIEAGSHGEMTSLAAHNVGLRAGHGRWRPVVNGGAQSSKACEGATLPWVQIPPPPPLTWGDQVTWSASQQVHRRPHVARGHSMRLMPPGRPARTTRQLSPVQWRRLPPCVGIDRSPQQEFARPDRYGRASAARA